MYGFREDFDWNNRFDLKTEINGYIVSTVDLGINHNFGGGEPLWYETMIFRKKGKHINYLELYCKRYHTEEEARKGHKEAIELAKNGLESEDE